MRPQPSISASRVALGVIIGFFLLVAVQIAFAGTIFDENGNKIGVCQGSTCTLDSGNGGAGGTINNGGAGGSGGSSTVGIVNAPVNTVGIVNAPTTTLTASPSSASNAKATSSAKSRSTSRSRSSSSAKATGGKAKATGGNATTTVTSNPSQTTSVSVQSGSGGGTDLSKMVPDVYAPALTTSGDDMCVGSTSGGLGLSGIGAMLGFTFTDDHCQTIKAVKLLVTMNRTDAAIRRACMDDKMREALDDECPQRKQGPSPSSSSTFTH